MKNSVTLLSFIVVCFFAGQVSGQTLSVKEKTANLRSSPSLTGSIVLLQVPLHYPLKLQDENGEFLHVKDYRGREGWIAKNMVGSENSVVVNAGTVNVRQGPGQNYPIVFKAKTGVTFRFLESKGDWFQVEHESGRKGWIFKNLVWGL